MFCSFSTTPAEASSPGKPVSRNLPTRRRSVLTWGLIGVWLMLMSFGVISTMDPPWLQEWASRGLTAETGAYKGYGDALLHQGEYRLAIAQYQKALRMSPDRVSVMVNLAVAYMHVGALDKARQILAQASRLDTDRLGLIDFNVGELVEREGRTEEAIVQYRKAVGTLVEQDLVYRKLGLLLLEAGRYAEALEAFDSLLVCQTDVTLPYRDMLRRCLEYYEGDTVHLPVIERLAADAVHADDLAPYDLDIIRQLQASDPEIAKTHNYRGLLRIRMEDYAAAAGPFSESLRIWPGNADAKRGLYLAQQAEKRDRLSPSRD